MNQVSIDGLKVSHSEANENPLKLSATPFVFPNLRALPVRPWLYGHFLMRGIVSGVIAGGGVGKSTLTLTIGLSLASGKQLLHDKPHGKLKVWFWNGEDSPVELQKRIGASCLFHGLVESDIQNRIFVDSGCEQEIIIAQAAQGKKAVLNEATIEAIKTTISENKIDCVVIDPFISSHRVEENDNGAIDLVVKTWAKIAQDCNCAVLIVHHVSKNGGNGAIAENARGASSFLGALRAAWVLNPMSKDEAEKAGIENPFEYVAIEDGKANLAPRQSNTKWLKIESVNIGNGNGFDELSGDFVGVVSKWEMPDAFDEVTIDDLRDCQDAINCGEFKHNPQAAAWVGYAIAQTLDWDIGDKAIKAKVKKIIETWIKNASLKKVHKYDAKAKREAPFVEVGIWCEPRTTINL